MALTSARDLEIAALDGEQQLAIVGVVLIELLRRLVEGARQLRDLGRPLDGHADAEGAAGQPARALARGRATGVVMSRAKKNATTSDSASASAVQPPACARSRAPGHRRPRAAPTPPGPSATGRAARRRRAARAPVGEVGDDGERVPARPRDRCSAAARRRWGSTTRSPAARHARAIGMRHQPPAIVDDVGDAAPSDPRVLDELLHAPQAHLRSPGSDRARGSGVTSVISISRRRTDG